MVRVGAQAGSLALGASVWMAELESHALWVIPGPQRKAAPPQSQPLPLPETRCRPKTAECADRSGSTQASSMPSSVRHRSQLMRRPSPNKCE
jgi:hypothetical protein